MDFWNSVAKINLRLCQWQTMFPWKNQNIFDKHVNSKLSLLFSPTFDDIERFRLWWNCKTLKAYRIHSDFFILSCLAFTRYLVIGFWNPVEELCQLCQLVFDKHVNSKLSLLFNPAFDGYWKNSAFALRNVKTSYKFILISWFLTIVLTA